MGISDVLMLKTDRKYLIMVAGLMWCGVGVMLMTFAATWLTRYTGKGAYLFLAAGILAGIPIHLFGFRKLAGRNIERLLEITEKRSIFSFITVKSYLTIIFMVALGITLRHSSIPKQYLSVVYNGIGLGLFLSGTKYIQSFIKLASGSNN
jgi:preprotein translocase subunit SecY